MSKKRPADLDWQVIDIQAEIGQLLKVVRDDLSVIPPRHKRASEKLTRWVSQLETIRSGLQHIDTVLVPQLEAKLGLSLDRRRLLSVSLFQPSTKNLFLELHTHYREKERARVDCEALLELVSMSEVAKVLALVGDAAIDMAVLHHLWKPRASDVGTLSQGRAGLVSNDHLSEKCDEWGLYESRIHFDPPSPTKSEIAHTKGTLVEALFGVIYIEEGFDVVKDTVRHLF
jgi:dsRNA-specific ribonuclease